MALARYRGGGRGGAGRGGAMATHTGHGSDNCKRLTGYGERLSAELRTNPAARVGAIMTDAAMYSQARLPGDEDCSVTLDAGAGPDHVPGQKGGAPRQVLCFAVPGDFMLDNAAAYVDYRVNANTVICRHLRALSFFFHTVYGMAQLDRRKVDVYVEAVVRDTGRLAVVSGAEATHTMAEFRAMPEKEVAAERMNVTAALNLSGYRVWVVLGSDAYGFETAMQRALFRNQHLANMCTEDALKYKLQFTIIPDSAGRRTAISARADAEIRAEKARKRKPGHDAPADAAPADAALADDDAIAEYLMEAPAVAGPDDGPDHARLVAERAVRISDAIAMPPAHALREAARRFTSEAAAQFVQITSAEDMVRHFYEPVLAAAGLDAAGLLSADLLAELTGEWGEAVPLGARVPGLSAASVLDFEHSVLAFNARQQPYDKACDVQCSAAAYGLDAGRLEFPVPALVWRLASHRTAPDTLLNYTLPWAVSRYAEQMRQLRATVQLAERERARRTAHGRGGTLVSAATMMTMTVSASRRVRAARLSRAFLEADDNYTQTLHGSLTQRLGREPITFGAAPSADALRTESLALLERASKNCERDPLQCALEEADTRTTTEHITSGVSDLMRANIASWAETQALVERMPAAPGLADEEAIGVRAESLRHYSRLRSEDAMRNLMQTLDKGNNVAHMHRGAFRALGQRQTLDDLVRPNVSHAPHMTVAANAVIAHMQHSALLSLQHGEVELFETSGVLIPEAAIPGLKNANHTVHIGAPATAKSLIDEYAREAAPAGAIMPRDVVSSRAEYTPKMQPAALQQFDEAGASIIDHRPEAIAKDPERFRTKSQLSDTYRYTERYVSNPETGDITTQRTAVESTSVKKYNTNVAHFGGFGCAQPDMAIPSRVNYYFFLPYLRDAYTGGARGGLPVDALTNLDSDHIRRVWQAICDRRRVEGSVVIMLVLLATTHVCTSYNTTCVDVVLEAAFRELSPWIPDATTQMRLGARAKQYGTTLLFTTTAHALLNSEDTPLAEWTHNGTRHEPLNETWALSDLAAIAAPHLYTRVDHGLWAVMRFVNTYYQLPLYMILREIASVECGFVRTWFHSAYRRCEVPLLDDAVEKRWRERGCSTGALPMFVQYLLEQEAVMDHTAIIAAGGAKPPTFVRCGRAADGADANTRAGAEPGGIRPVDRAQRAASEYERNRIVDPNWLDTGKTKAELVRAAVVYLGRRVRIEETQVEAALDKISAHVRVRVPVFADIKPGVLGSRPVAPSDIHTKIDTDALDGGRIRFENERVIKEGFASGRSYRTVWLNVGAMMVPPHLLLCLALTAFENEHTRRRETVLIDPVPHNSSYCVPWQVRPRTAGTVVAGANKIAGALDRRLSTRARADNDPVAIEVAALHRTATDALRIDRDLEDIAFERHMRELHSMPPMAEALAILADMGVDTTAIRNSYWARHPYTEAGAPPPDAEMPRPTAAEVEATLRLWIDNHTAGPRRAAARRAALQSEVPRLAPVATSLSPHFCYPCSNIMSREVTDALAELAPRVEPLPRTLGEIDEAKEAARAAVAAADDECARVEADGPPELVQAARARQNEAYNAQAHALALEELCVVKPVREQRPSHVTLGRLARAQRAAMALLCSEPMYSTHTRALYETPEWRPVVAAALARFWGVTDHCPGQPRPLASGDAALVRRLLNAPTESEVAGADARKAWDDECKALRGALPGWDAPAPRLVMLRWLERSFVMRELLDDITLVYATHPSRPAALLDCVSLLGDHSFDNAAALAAWNRALESYALDQTAAAQAVLTRYESADRRCAAVEAEYATRQRDHWNVRTKLWAADCAAPPPTPLDTLSNALDVVINAHRQDGQRVAEDAAVQQAMAESRAAMTGQA